MRNALFASAHPCYIGGGYRCECGRFSGSSKEHVMHVRSNHPGADESSRLLSWRHWSKMWGFENKDSRSFDELLKEAKAKEIER